MIWEKLAPPFVLLRAPKRRQRQQRNSANAGSASSRLPLGTKRMEAYGRDALPILLLFVCSSPGLRSPTAFVCAFEGSLTNHLLSPYHLSPCSPD